MRLLAVIMICILLPAPLLAELPMSVSAPLQSGGELLGSAFIPVPDALTLERPGGDPFAIPGYAVRKAPSYLEAEETRISRARQMNERNVRARAASTGQGLKTGLSAGSVGQRIFLSAATGTVSGLLQGRSVKETLGTVKDEIATEEFLIGRVLGGTLGASLASALPMPAMGGILGRVVAPLPALSAALILGGLGAEFVGAWKAGDPDLGRILRDFDYLGVLSQAVGSSLLMGLAATLPLGSIAVVVAGVAGAFAGEWAMAALRDLAGKAASQVQPLVSGEGSGTTGPAAPSSSSSSGDEGRISPSRSAGPEAYRHLVRALSSGSRDEARRTFAVYCGRP